MIDVPPASSSTKKMLDVDKKRGLIASKPPKVLQCIGDFEFDEGHGEQSEMWYMARQLTDTDQNEGRLMRATPPDNSSIGYLW